MLKPGGNLTVYAPSCFPFDPVAAGPDVAVDPGAGEDVDPGDDGAGDGEGDWDDCGEPLAGAVTVTVTAGLAAPAAVGADSRPIRNPAAARTTTTPVIVVIETKRSSRMRARGLFGGLLGMLMRYVPVRNESTEPTRAVGTSDNDSILYRVASSMARINAIQLIRDLDQATALAEPAVTGHRRAIADLGRGNQ